MNELNMIERFYNTCESNYNLAESKFKILQKENPELNLRCIDTESLQLFNKAILHLVQAKCDLDHISDGDFKELYKEKNIKKIEDSNLKLETIKLLSIIAPKKIQLYFNHIDDLAQRKGYHLSEENNTRLAKLCKEQVHSEIKDLIKLFSSGTDLGEIYEKVEAEEANRFPVHLLDKLNLKDSDKTAGPVSDKTSDTSSDEDKTIGTSKGSPVKKKTGKKSKNKCAIM